MTKPTPAQIEAANTDRELWRERDGDYYADSIHVTKEGNIGINCGGNVVAMPLRKWFALAAALVTIEDVAAVSGRANASFDKIAADRAAEVEDRKHFVMGAFATPPANLGMTANTSLAAAEIVENNVSFSSNIIESAVAATIERCAQAVATATLTLGDATETRANCVAAIRALKDKP